MPRARSDNDHQVAFKVPAAWLTTADAIASERSIGGFTTTRTEVLRAALKTGLERLELEAVAMGRKARAASKRSRARRKIDG